MPEVSVVIPSKNEEKTISVCIEKLKQIFSDSDIDGEIIVADNSTDRTPEIAQALGAIVVTPDKLGYGYAYVYGFRHASGKYLVMGDADDTYDFSIVPRLLEPLLKEEADFIVGSRLKGTIKEGAMPWLHRYIGNPAITWLFNRIFGANLSDACSGMFALTKEAWDKINVTANGWDFNQQMLLGALRNGLRVGEVPIIYHPRREGASKLTSLQGGWHNLKFLMSHLFFRLKKRNG